MVQEEKVIVMKDEAIQLQEKVNPEIVIAFNAPMITIPPVQIATPQQSSLTTPSTSAPSIRRITASPEREKPKPTIQPAKPTMPKTVQKDERAIQFEKRLKIAMQQDDIQTMAELIFEIKDLNLHQVIDITEAENMVFGD